MERKDPSSVADLIRRGRAGRPLLLLCDFDGTLCEFQNDPAAVWLRDDRRALLSAIQSQPLTTLGLISGRRLADVALRSGLGTDSIYIAGLHGLEIEGGGERFDHPDLAGARTRAQRIADDLRPRVSGVAGVFIEDKGLSIALHFRDASPADGQLVTRMFAGAVRDAVESGAVRVMRGASVLEVLPNIAWHKGSAVEWIRGRVERHGAAPFTVYMGDDATDEDAFRAVAGLGLSIAASARVTGADYMVDGPAEIEQILAALGSTTGDRASR